MDDRFVCDLIDDNLVVVDRDCWTLSVFNGTAAYLWLSLKQGGCDLRSVEADLATIYPSAAATLRADLMPVLADWRNRGWLEEAGDLLAISERPGAGPEEFWRPLTPSDYERATHRCSTVWSADLEFLGRAAGVTIGSVTDPCHRDFVGRAKAFLGGIPRSRAGAAERIHAHVAEDAIYLTYGESRLATEDAAWALSRIVLWCFHAAYGADRLAGTLHAAAVGRGDGMIVMPAVSGAGKSTLTAYLVALGWTYGGDDIVGLGTGPVVPGAEEEDLEVLPLPSAMSIKQGSVAVLGGFYPDLAALPEIRYDAKAARFQPVAPARVVGQMAAERRPLALVFPEYAAGAETELSRLSTTQALVELATVGIRTGERLEAEGLRRLFRFFDRIPKFALRYSSLPEAAECLRAL